MIATNEIAAAAASAMSANIEIDISAIVLRRLTGAGCDMFHNRFEMRNAAEPLPY